MRYINIPTSKIYPAQSMPKQFNRLTQLRYILGRVNILSLININTLKGGNMNYQIFGGLAPPKKA
jgi:hypothetical protein